MPEAGGGSAKGGGNGGLEPAGPAWGAAVGGSAGEAALGRGFWQQVAERLGGNRAASGGREGGAGQSRGQRGPGPCCSPGVTGVSAASSPRRHLWPQPFGEVSGCSLFALAKAGMSRVSAGALKCQIQPQPARELGQDVRICIRNIFVS